MKILFAPLQGYTEDAYRRLHHLLCGGVDEYYTPFVRLENEEIRSKDARDINPKHNEGVPTVPQVIARDGKELLTLLTTIMPLGYQHIDINMGCPFPLQTRHGRGAGILPHPDKVMEICKIIQDLSTNKEREDGTQVSFSVKMRLGLEGRDEWREIIPILNGTPLRHITLHPRVGIQQYKGETDMEAFEEFLHLCSHPVVYNGDITTPQQIEHMASTYPLHGIMLGRGLLARPTLAAEYRQGYELSAQQLIATVKQLHERLLAHYANVIPAESQRLMKIRTFWDYMEPQLDRKQWKKIVKAGNMKNYLAAIDALSV